MPDWACAWESGGLSREGAAARASTGAQRIPRIRMTASVQPIRFDGYVSLGVVVGAVAVAFGVPIADPLIGLGITVVILQITWASWRTVRGHDHAQ